MPRVPLPRLRLRTARRLTGSLDTLTEYLRQETTGGKLLLAATAAALLWANLAGGSYEAVWQTDVAFGPAWLHLDLPLAGWVADGLLAIFFFVAGLEVKRELTVGELAGWRAAALPIAAAAGGMVLPAVVALAASRGAAAGGGAWAIPVATDIAFALGVLALAGSALPSGVRILLLSMAVIDDLGAITLIAILFTQHLSLAWLAGAALLCAGYWWAQRRRAPGWLLVPLALAVWVCLHASGVHATVAGIALGLLTPVRPAAGEAQARGEMLERRLHPLSAGIVVPLFALAAAGIPLTSIPQAVTDPVAHGIVAGLLIGKTLGILGGTWLAVRTRAGALPDGVGWADVLPVAVLGGIGYTVSLLVTELALPDPASQSHAATAVQAGSLAAAEIAILLLRRRSRQH
ncbi:Na+/H+ antiporter NhaA [Micromonospora sp. CPCC 205371]|nr:Na+/H+ antiporter NhaA [Micromonospora sp. CPCC 205371]